MNVEKDPGLKEDLESGKAWSDFPGNKGITRGAKDTFKTKRHNTCFDVENLEVVFFAG